MFPVTITLHNAADLNAVMVALAHMTGTAPAASTPKAEAPGKPSAAPTAPSADAPAPSPVATPPAAAATSAAPPVTYPDLQKAVLALHKMDPQAAVPIAKSLGADTFKLLPEAKWAEALRLVNEAIEARKAA